MAGRPTTPIPATITEEKDTMANSDVELQALITAEAEGAEATRDQPIPADALQHATRPNRAKSMMFSLRLNPNELAELQAVAEARGVPASTLVRGWITQRLTAEHTTPNDTTLMLDRLENDVRVLRKLVTR
jgi:hypothetical protein